jgi:sugar fermentation stimulation protein A
MKRPPGSYILFLRLTRTKRIRVGKLGMICFPAGLYAYVGSALGGWEARVNRHLAGGSKAHWHIDYLRAEARVEGAIIFESPERLECEINEAIAEASLIVAPGFGSSDCDCLTHLHLLKFEKLD